VRVKRFQIFALMVILFCFLQGLSIAASDIDFPKEQFLDEHAYSTEELLQYASNPSVTWQYDNYGVDDLEWRIIDGLVKKKETNKLLTTFEHPVDEFQEMVVARALSDIDDDAIYSVFKKHINGHDTTDTMYACLNFLAKRGDKDALKILNDNYFNYGSSSEWAKTVIWFGKYKYKPAIPNLIGSLDAASLDLVSAAQWSLEQLFDGPHPKFNSIGEMKHYFEKQDEKNR
jgi:hypothetical protein